MATRWMRLGFVVVGLSLVSVAARGGQWSDKAQCDQQYEKDSERCRKSKRAACWSSASDRLAYCNRTGETGKPSLIDE